MNFLLAILAGLVQGLTEFLPISSTGHLIIFENLFGISQQKFGLTFDASLHLGTLLAILFFFYKDYLAVFKNKLFLKLLVGSIPAVVFGLLFENLIEGGFRQIWVLAAALILFSPVIFYAEKKGKKAKGRKDLNLKDALIVGFAQGLALIPGISRSGSTISAGLLLGLKRQEAASFSFILAGPIIAAAGAKKFLEVLTSEAISSADFNFFLIGMVSSAIFGFLTIKYFLKYLSTQTLYPFVIYRIILGLILILNILA